MVAIGQHPGHLGAQLLQLVHEVVPHGLLTPDTRAGTALAHAQHRACRCGLRHPLQSAAPAVAGACCANGGSLRAGSADAS